MPILSGGPRYLSYTTAAQKNKELWSLKSRFVLCFSISPPRTKGEVIHLEIALYDLLIPIHNTGLLILIMLDLGLEISMLCLT